MACSKTPVQGLPSPEDDSEDAYNRDAAQWLLQKMRLSEMRKEFIRETNALTAMRRMFEQAERAYKLKEHKMVPFEISASFENYHAQMLREPFDDYHFL